MEYNIQVVLYAVLESSGLIAHLAGRLHLHADIAKQTSKMTTITHPHNACGCRCLNLGEIPYSYRLSAYDDRIRVWAIDLYSLTPR